MQRLERLVSQRLFGLSLGYEDMNDQIRADGVLALAVGCSDLAGEERVRERDRCIPLAGSSTVNRLGVPGEAETHRYKKIAAGALDDLKLSLDACPSPSKEWTSTPPTTWCMATGRGVTSTATTTHTATFLFVVWDDLVLAVAACERRPGGVHGGGAGAGAHSRASAGEQGSRRRRAATGRGAKTTGSTTCSACPASPADGAAGSCASRAAAASRPARHRGSSAVSVTGPERLGAGRGGWWRSGCRILAASRPLRRDFAGLQAGGGAGSLRRTVLRAQGEPRSGSLFVDRTATGEAVAPRLCGVRQPPGGGDSEGRLGRRRGGQGAGRNDSDEGALRYPG